MQVVRLLFVFFLLVSPTTTSFVDDIFDMCGNWIADAAGSLIGDAKKAFEEAMNDFVTNDLIPVIQMIQALLDRDIQEVDNDIKALVANVESFIQNEVQEAFLLAQKFADETIDEIEQKIIDRTFQDLSAYTQTLFVDVNAILDKIEQLEDRFLCTEESVIDEIIALIKEEFGLEWWIVDPWDPCREEVSQMFPDDGLRYKFFSEYSSNQLYYYTKCTYLHPLSPNSTILEIREAYRDWGALAAHMRCGSVAVDDQVDVLFYLQEMGEASRRYHIWDSAMKSLKLGMSKQIHQSNVKNVAKKPVRQADPNCSTPLECFEEAYRMLKQAEQDIQNFKDLAVIANSTANKAVKTANQANSIANALNTTANTANSTANSALSKVQAVDSRTACISGASIWVNCHPGDGLFFAFQTDGNFVLYNAGSPALHDWGFHLGFSKNVTLK